MADSDKDILITPQRGQAGDPTIQFKSGATAGDPITLAVTDDGTISTLSFEGSSGQLFSVTNSLTGTIFSVNDVSGIPSIEVLDDGTIKLAEFGGSVEIGGSLSSNIIKQPQVSVSATTTSTSLDFSASGNFYVTLSSSTTFSFLNISSNIGSSGYIFLKQDATGGRTITLPTEAKTPLGGATIAEVTTANSLSLITYYVVDASTVIVNYIGDFK